jgi:hypothetical protein
MYLIHLIPLQRPMPLRYLMHMASEWWMCMRKDLCRGHSGIHCRNSGSRDCGHAPTIVHICPHGLWLRQWPKQCSPVPRTWIWVEGTELYLMHMASEWWMCMRKDLCRGHSGIHCRNNRTHMPPRAMVTTMAEAMLPGTPDLDMMPSRSTLRRSFLLTADGGGCLWLLVACAHTLECIWVPFLSLPGIPPQYS